MGSGGEGAEGGVGAGVQLQLLILLLLLLYIHPLSLSLAPGLCTSTLCLQSCSCCMSSLVGVHCLPCAPNLAATVVAVAAVAVAAVACTSSLPLPVSASCTHALSSICSTFLSAVAAVAVAVVDALPLVLTNLFMPAPIYLHMSAGTCQPTPDGLCAWLHLSALIWPHLASFMVIHGHLLLISVACPHWHSITCCYHDQYFTIYIYLLTSMYI